MCTADYFAVRDTILCCFPLLLLRVETCAHLPEHQCAALTCDALSELITVYFISLLVYKSCIVSGTDSNFISCGRLARIVTHY